MVEGGKIGPAVSSSVTYPLTCSPEDVYAARMNDNFKVYYMLDMHKYGEYPGYYLNYLEKRGIKLKSEEGDKEILKNINIQLTQTKIRHKAKIPPNSSAIAENIKSCSTTGIVFGTP